MATVFGWIPVSRRQSQTSPPCVGHCITVQTESSNCSTSTDIACLCTSTIYAQSIVNCITANCPTQDFTSSVQYFDALCEVAGVTSLPNFTIPIPPALSPTATLGNSTIAASQPSSSSSFTSHSPSGTPTVTSDSRAGVIAGGVVGGVMILCLVIIFVWVYRGARSRSKTIDANFLDESSIYRASSFPIPVVGEASDPPIVASPYTPQESYYVASAGSHAHSPMTHTEARSQVSTSLVSPPSQIPAPPWIQGVEVGYNAGIPSGGIPVTVGDPSPPAYQDEEPGAPSTLFTRSPQVSAEVEDNSSQVYEDAISKFCSMNRDLISPTLADKLRTARYLPKDNPGEIPADYWQNTYGVDFFDLKRLQEAYERNTTTTASANEKPVRVHIHTPGSGRASWKP